jgi:hypothetical protein
MSEDKLIEFLKNGADWAKAKTSVPGIFVVKLPKSKNSPSRLSVEVNPVDAGGTPTKRRGLFIRHMGEFEEFKDLINNDKMETLLELLEDVNPPNGQGGKKSVDVIEI